MNKAMKTNSTGRLVCLLLATAILASTPQAARAQSPEQDAAYKVITDLFNGMRTRDTAAMRAAFTSNASMQSITPDSVRFNTIDGWITGVAGAPAGTVLDERLANAVILVDGNLANVWVDYWFFIGERFSHSGVDAYLLARQGGTWRIFSVVDTRRREGRPPAPGS
jgi:hypothetical protein